MILAQIVADSISEAGKRLTTFQLVYPYFIHAQVLRHRVFSSSVSSARAIPTARFRQMVIDNPAFPLHWGKNQPGMSAAEEVEDKASAMQLWDGALRHALIFHAGLENLGVHKEVANRILMPFQHVTHLVTATEWDNWYALRLSPKAQPEIRELALAMQRAHAESTPMLTNRHSPFLTLEELTKPGAPLVSAARCARTSYLPLDAKTWEQDLALAGKLQADKHWSPFEHVAQPSRGCLSHVVERNFRGWVPIRALLEEGIYAET